MTWRPMSTAPRDGTAILVWVKDFAEPVVMRGRESVFETKTAVLITTYLEACNATELIHEDEPGLLSPEQFTTDECWCWAELPEPPTAEELEEWELGE